MIAEPLLRCAYTGELLTIEKIEGTPLFRATGGFDPAAWVPVSKLAELKKKLRRRPGGKWVTKLVCPYKGTPIRFIEEDGLSVRADGVFSPCRAIWTDMREAEWEISWRDGVEPSFARTIRVTVGDPLGEMSDPREGIAEIKRDIIEKTGEMLR